MDWKVFDLVIQQGTEDGKPVEFDAQSILEPSHCFVDENGLEINEDFEMVWIQCDDQ